MPEASRDLFEIIATTRSMRRLKPDPVPTELIRKILEAGTAAPSGGNMQRWRFLVVTDPELKEPITSERGTRMYIPATARVLLHREPAPSGAAIERLARQILKLDPQISCQRLQDVSGPRNFSVQGCDGVSARGAERDGRSWDWTRRSGTRDPSI
jgi:hypothetical protein